VIFAIEQFWWAHGTLRDARRKLSSGQVSQLELTRAPRRSAGGAWGLKALLRLRPHSCLERALIVQHWLAGQGVLRSVVIGVGRPDGSFIAHAWVEGEEDELARSLHELTRLPP
jgi:hypothetical protein